MRTTTLYCKQEVVSKLGHIATMACDQDCIDLLIPGGVVQVRVITACLYWGSDSEDGTGSLHAVVRLHPCNVPAAHPQARWSLL